MKFTVTGATGFVGRALVERLIADRHYVHILGRARPLDLPSQCAWAAWNPVREEPPLEAISGYDAIVHLAGEPIAQRWTPDVKRRLRDSRAVGTRNLVAGIAKAKFTPRVLVSASAIGYYGDRGDEVLTEASPAGTGFLPEICIEWEREAMRATEYGVRVVCPRIGVVLGPGGGALEKMAAPFRLGAGGHMGSGRQWMSWIHIHDLVNLILFAALHDEITGPVNAVAPEPVRNRDFTKALASVLHRPALIPVPEFALKLAMGEMSRVVLDSQRVLPGCASHHGFNWQYGSLRDALQAAV